MIEEVQAAMTAAVDRAKDPTTYSWLTYAWVVVWSMLGGFVSWWGKVKAGEARPFNVAELVGEVATSAFAGITTFYICEWGGVDPLLSAVFIGIAGHMGTRFVFWVEKVLEKHLAERFGIRRDEL